MSSKLEQDISKLDYLFNQIKEPIVCVKCSDEFISGQTDAKSLQEYVSVDVGSNLVSKASIKYLSH